MTAFLTVRELASRLTISTRSAYKLIREQEFPVLRVRRKILIPEDQLNIWISKGGTSPQERRRA